MAPPSFGRGFRSLRWVNLDGFFVILREFFFDGFSGRWLRRHVGEVLKRLMSLIGNNGRSVLYTLMGWLEDGSVVTWCEVLKKLMVLTGNASRCVPYILMGCGKQPWFGWNLFVNALLCIWSVGLEDAFVVM